MKSLSAWISKFVSLKKPGYCATLNPLSGLSIFEVFVVPILLYECETCLLTPALLSKLEKLQSEIGKHILKLSKYHADLAPIIRLHLHSIKAHIAIWKIHVLPSYRKAILHPVSFEHYLLITSTLLVLWNNAYGFLKNLVYLSGCCGNVYLILTSNDVKDLWNIILKHNWSQSVNSARRHTSRLPSLT